MAAGEPAGPAAAGALSVVGGSIWSMTEFPPASEERITAMEARLGRRMPPSYREFLAVTDGWRHAGGFVWLLAGTAEARWHDNDSGLADDFAEYLEEDATAEERREAAIWRSGLQLDVESDALYVLMDPEDADEHGEWAVYTWAGWRAAPPVRHASFWEYMHDMHIGPSGAGPAGAGRTGSAGPAGG